MSSALSSPRSGVVALRVATSFARVRRPRRACYFDRVRALAEHLDAQSAALRQQGQAWGQRGSGVVMAPSLATVRPVSTTTEAAHGD
jgi:hypothetical protein